MPLCLLTRVCPVDDIVRENDSAVRRNESMRSSAEGAISRVSPIWWPATSPSTGGGAVQPSRIFVCALAVTLLCIWVTACGSSGATLAQSYSSRALGVSVRYPRSWSVIPVRAQIGVHIIAFGIEKGSVYVTLHVFPRGKARFEVSVQSVCTRSDQ
jgi:hypothetical protein